MKSKFYQISLLLSIITLLYSCGTEEEVLQDALTISADTQQVYTGNTIEFMATSQNNGDVTTTAEFVVNDQVIESNTYTPTVANENNQAYATWNGLRSNTITFNSVDEVVLPSTYTQKVLVEDYTGTWCGYCPGMNNIINHYSDYNSNIVPVAIHCDNGDPFEFAFDEQLKTAYNVSGLPAGRIGRVHNLNLFTENFVTDYCGTNASFYQDQIAQYTDRTAPLGLAINSDLEGNNLSFEVKIGFVTDQIIEPKLVVYLLEDGLIYDQVNFFASDGNSDCVYSSMPNPIPDFEHNHVLQKAYTDVFGDPIPSEEVFANAQYSRSFEVTLPSNIENSENLSLVAFVTGTNGEVLNVQYAHVGEDQDFD